MTCRRDRPSLLLKEEHPLFISARSTLTLRVFSMSHRNAAGRPDHPARKWQNHQLQSGGPAH